MRDKKKEDHMDLSKYAGKVVAFSHDRERIIASGTDLTTTLDRAKKKSEKDPIISPRVRIVVASNNGGDNEFLERI